MSSTPIHKKRRVLNDSPSFLLSLFCYADRLHISLIPLYRKANNNFKDKGK